MEQTRSKKFPFTEFHKAYGFRPGGHRLTWVYNEPSTFQEGDENLLLQLDIDDAPICHWLWLDGKWNKIDWDVLLDPINLRIRRIFNEELSKRHVDNDSKKEPEPLIFVHMKGGKKRTEYYKMKYHKYHNREDVEDGFYCHTCKRGIKSKNES